MDEQDGCLLKNTRPIQPRGTRKVRISDEEDPLFDSSLTLLGGFSLPHETDRSETPEDEEFTLGDTRTTQRRDELYQWQH